jgi:hypothetical protein
MQCGVRVFRQRSCETVSRDCLGRLQGGLASSRTALELLRVQPPVHSAQRLGGSMQAHKGRVGFRHTVCVAMTQAVLLRVVRVFGDDIAVAIGLV